MPNKGEWWWYCSSLGNQRPFVYLENTGAFHCRGYHIGKDWEGKPIISHQHTLRTSGFQYRLAPKELGVWNDD